MLLKVVLNKVQLFSFNLQVEQILRVDMSSTQKQYYKYVLNLCVYTQCYVYLLHQTSLLIQGGY